MQLPVSESLMPLRSRGGSLPLGFVGGAKALDEALAMVSIGSDLNELHRGVKSALSARWRLLTFGSVALIVLGVPNCGAVFRDHWEGRQ